MAFQFLTIPTLDAIPGPVANVSLSSENIVSLADPVNPQDADTLNARNNAIAALGQTNNSQILTGCGVVWTGGLNFTVAAGTYTINGTTYSVAQTNLTLSAADPTNPRFDVIALNTSGAAVVITGTPAANPLVPTVDPSTQLLDTIISVPAGATQPGNITNLVQYAEDAGAPTEWNATTNSAGTINLASTNNPHGGTKCIEGTAVIAGNYIQLAQGSGTVNLSNYNNLIFYIRSKASWPSQKSFTISFLNAGTQQGNALTFQNGSFGFASSNTTSYQQIVIPLANFNIGNTPVNQLKFLTAGGGSSIGFYMDDVSLQAGVVIGSQAFMVWKQVWNSTTAYIANNVVTDGRSLWLALLPNTNSEPNEGNSNWQWLGSQVPVTRNDYGSFTIPDGGSLYHPTQLTVSGSEQITVSGSGQLTIYDPANQVPGKSNINPAQSILRSGEYLRLRSQLQLLGNEQFQVTEDATVYVLDDTPSYAVNPDPVVNSYRSLGSSIIAQNIGMSLANVTVGVAMASGNVQMMAIYIPQPVTLTGAKFFQLTTGNYTANNNNKLGLYQLQGGVSAVLVAQTANDGTIWKNTTSSVGSRNFTSQYLAVPGIYYVAFIWNSSSTSTTPTLGAMTAVAAAGVSTGDFPSPLFGGIAAGSTDLPSVIVPVLANANGDFWCAVY